MLLLSSFFFFFFFNDTATTEIYTLSLHDALPIYVVTWVARAITQIGTSHLPPDGIRLVWGPKNSLKCQANRSEEHTSELQSRLHLVCRLLLEKKKKKQYKYIL